MKKLHDRSTAWCEPSGSTNSDRQRRGIRERILLRGPGSGKVLNRIRVTLWARPAWGSLPCPASFLIVRPCLPSPTRYARAHSGAARARWTLVVRRRRKPEGGRFQRRPRRAETITCPKFTLAAAPGQKSEDCGSRGKGQAPGARYAGLFFVAWSTSSGVISTVVLRLTRPLAPTVRATAAAVMLSGTSTITKASVSPNAK